MAKRHRIHGRYRRDWPRGVEQHFRRRIAAWRKRGFSEDEVRAMAHDLRTVGPGYQGPSIPKAELERNARAHINGTTWGGNHNHRVPGPAYTPPEKHHSKYRAKRRG